MLKSSCCSICISVNRRTINIIDTDLQFVYENLANCKIRDDECWMCYICHKRLRQCHLLQQSARQTRGLIAIIFQNKMNIKNETNQPLLELSISETKITSLHIKEEDAYGDEENQILDNSFYYEKEEQYDGKSEDTQELSNVEKFKQNNDKLEPVKPIEIVNVEYRPHTTVKLVTESLQGNRKQTWGERITKSVDIKEEVTEEVRGEGIDHDVQDSRNTKVFKCHKKTFSCDVCSKAFTDKCLLIYHIRTHTGEKPFSCDICSKKFSRKNVLNSHRIIHSNVKPYSCEICSKAFSQKSNLNNHMISHTGVKLFTCDMCSKKFSYKSQLTYHIVQVHMGDKPLSCDICSHKFVFNSRLKRHMQKHTGEQPFSCGICLKRFTCKSSLNHHTTIHTGDKNHICHICGKKFAVKRYLNVHLRGHTGVKRFSCDICSKEFKHKSSLNSHKRVHSSKQ